MNWDSEHDKLVYSAMRKATSGFTSMPRGYEIEDMLQEGALAVWQALEKGRYDENRGKLSTFIFKVTRDKYIDLIKGANRDKRKIEQYTVEYDEEITGAALNGNLAKKDPRGNIGRDYDGDSNATYKPLPRGTKDCIRYQLEKEPDLKE